MIKSLVALSTVAAVDGKALRGSGHVKVHIGVGGGVGASGTTSSAASAKKPAHPPSHTKWKTHGGVGAGGASGSSPSPASSPAPTGPPVGVVKPDTKAMWSDNISLVRLSDAGKIVGDLSNAMVQCVQTAGTDAKKTDSTAFEKNLTDLKNKCAKGQFASDCASSLKGMGMDKNQYGTAKYLSFEKCQHSAIVNWFEHLMMTPFKDPNPPEVRALPIPDDKELNNFSNGKIAEGIDQKEASAAGHKHIQVIKNVVDQLYHLKWVIGRQCVTKALSTHIDTWDEAFNHQKDEHLKILKTNAKWENCVPSGFSAWKEYMLYAVANDKKSAIMEAMSEAIFKKLAARYSHGHGHTASTPSEGKGEGTPVEAEESAGAPTTASTSAPVEAEDGKEKPAGGVKGGDTVTVVKTENGSTGKTAVGAGLVGLMILMF